MSGLRPARRGTGGRPRRPGAAGRTGLAALLLLAATAGGGAAAPRAAPGGLSPGGSGPAAPAEPAGARISLAGGAASPAPSALRVWPDSVAFGSPVLIALDFPAGTAIDRHARLSADADWVRWLDAEKPRGTARRGAEGQGKLPAHPPWPRAAGPRVVAAACLDELGAVALSAGDGGAGLAARVEVRSTLPSDAKPAGVRDPRGLGWRRDRLALLAGLVLAALAVARWRRRRARPWRPQDAPLSPPAYLAAAIGLRELVCAGWLERGQGRRFLDGLASRLRAFASARYRLAADALAPPEIAARLTALRYPPRDAERLAQCLDECDRRRFSPEPVGKDVCSELLAGAVAILASGRVPARFTPVPDQLARDGEAAWRHLVSTVGNAPRGGSAGEAGHA